MYCHVSRDFFVICCQDAVKDFERNLSDMVATFIENVQGHTSVLRDLENTHHQRLEEIAMVTLEKVVKNEMEDDIPDDLRDVSNQDYPAKISRLLYIFLAVL